MGLFNRNRREACGISFKSKDELMAHNKKAHNKMQTFECKMCQMTFDSEKEMMNHNRKTHKM